MYRHESWTMKKVECRSIDASKWWFGKAPWEFLGLQDQTSQSKGNQSWIFIGRTDAEAPILWPPDGKNQLIRKDPDVGKDWRQEEKGMTEDDMVGWHHWLNGYEFEQAPELVMDMEAWRAIVHGRGRKELDMTEQLNWLKPKIKSFFKKQTQLEFSNFTNNVKYIFPTLSHYCHILFIWC